jgi:hypothetical protein
MRRGKERPMSARIIAKNVEVSGVQAAHRRGYGEAKRVSIIEDLTGIATDREVKQGIVESVTISFESVQPLAESRRIKSAAFCERTQDEISRERIRDIEIPSADIFSAARGKQWRKRRRNLANSGVCEA